MICGESCSLGERPTKSSSKMSINSPGKLIAKVVASSFSFDEKRSQHSLARRGSSEFPARIPVAKPFNVAGAKVEACPSLGEGLFARRT